MEYIIRRATTEDVPQIKTLFVQMLQAIYQKEDVPSYPDGYLETYFISSKYNQIYVADLEGEIMAYLSVECHFEKENFLYLDDFSVAPKYRRKGIGTALVSCAHNYARQLCIDKVYLHVEASNTSALSLYKKMGYQVFQLENGRVKMLKSVAKKNIE